MGEFKLRRGLKNVFVAEILTDDATGYTTGTPYHVMPAGEMTRNAQTSTNNVWYDDDVFATVGTEGATAVQISGASLRGPQIAKLLGKTVDTATGAVIDSGTFKEKYWALGGEAEGLDGSVERFWLLKGLFTAPEESDKTIDETTDANGMTLNFNAIKTTHVFSAKNETCKKVQIDSTTTALKTGKVWTDQVVTPDNLSTICEKIIETTGVTVTPSTASVAVNGTTTLTAALTPAGATGDISWSTSNAAVATVTAGGVVTGLTAGTAVITATSGTFSASCTVTVTE